MDRPDDHQVRAMYQIMESQFKKQEQAGVETIIARVLKDRESTVDFMLAVIKCEADNDKLIDMLMEHPGVGDIYTQLVWSYAAKIAALLIRDVRMVNDELERQGRT